jgi:hypothetical protein
MDRNVRPPAGPIRSEFSNPSVDPGLLKLELCYGGVDSGVRFVGMCDVQKITRIPDVTGRPRIKPDAKSGPSFLTTPPTVSLPKGGGAIRGIGENFAANPALSGWV